MAHKRLFYQKPYRGANGIYSYDNDTTVLDRQQYFESNGVPENYDKFIGKDLYTISVGDPINEAILQSKMQEKYGGMGNDGQPQISSLKYLGESYLRINSLNIVNRGVRSDINDVYFRIFLFTKRFFDPFDGNGNIRGYNDLRADLNKDNQAALFWSQNGPNYRAGGSPGNLIENLTVIHNFDTINNLSTDPSAGLEYPRRHTGFDPLKSMPKVGGIEPTDITTIFQENNSDNPVYIAIHMDGDQDTFFDRSRNETIDIWEINPNDLFIETGTEKIGKITTLDYKSHTAERFSSNQSRTAAFSGRELSITVNTVGGVTLAASHGGDPDSNGLYRPPLEYLNITDSIIPPYDTKNDYDELILNMKPQRQIQSSIDSPVSYDEDTDFYSGKFANYLPVSVVQMPNPDFSDGGFAAGRSPIDLQHYYEDEKSKIFASTPLNVDLQFFIDFHPEPFGEDGLIAQYQNYNVNLSSLNNGYQLNNKYRDGQNYLNDAHYGTNPFTATTAKTYIDRDDGVPGGSASPLYTDDVDYAFFVIDWNDEEDKYKTIDDVMLEWPTTLTELINKRDENLYIPKIIDKKGWGFTTDEGFSTLGYGAHYHMPPYFNPISDYDKHKLTNQYTTPGIKTIKTIMFSYDYRDVYKLEPLRWKLITSKIFLDIPVSEYPDFNTLGGSDYTTIPWPNTTPVIGGVSQDSKYMKSVNDTLASGNISNNDIITQTFLVNAQENDELGQNIEKMDLEQTRFFNKSYDMNTLLNVTVSNQVISDVESETLATLPFPFWAEEFDIDGQFILTGDASLINSQMWIEYGRPDIAEYIDRLRNSAENNLQTGDELIGGVVVYPAGAYSYEEAGIADGSMCKRFNFGQIGQNLSSGNLTNNSWGYSYEDCCSAYYGGEAWQYTVVPNPSFTEASGIGPLFGTAHECYNSNLSLYDLLEASEYQYPDPGDYSYTWPPPSQVHESTDGVFGSSGGWTGGVTSGGEGMPPQWGPPIHEPGDGDGVAGDDDDIPEFEFTEQDAIEQWRDFFVTSIQYDWADDVILPEPYNDNNGDSVTYLQWLTTFIEDSFPSTPSAAIINWAMANFYVGYPDTTTPSEPGQSGMIASGCDLPSNNIFVTPDGYVLYNSSQEIAGFQMEFDAGLGHFESVSGGAIEEYGYNVSFNNQDSPNNNIVLGFAFEGLLTGEGVIPAGCGTLMQITWNWNEEQQNYFNNNAIEISIEEYIFSNQQSEAINLENFQHIEGCMNEYALNFNPQATYTDNTECEFTNYNSTDYFYNLETINFEIYPNLYTDHATIGYYDDNNNWVSNGFWDGSSPERTFSEESSVGQIFISNNVNQDLIENCTMELNTGNILETTINDSSGHLNKGLLIGDYKITKTDKNEPMRRDSFIKVPKKASNTKGAL